MELGAYFKLLCDSIAASMIGEGHDLKLTVGGAGGVVSPRVSVSMGLIVTELVINALKHAFPHAQSGSIVVSADVRGPNWSLSVKDDGVGMPANAAEIHTGLGTSIVQALAQQLEAVVEVTPARPGTMVSISHTQIALVDGDETAAALPSTIRPAA